MSTSLSIIVNTRNAAKTLERTLLSLKFADELIVADMESDDDTIKIAKKFTKKIFNHKNVGYVEPARNFAIQKASNDWVLIVDADEVIPEKLQKKVNSLVTLSSDVACYYIPRKNIIFGKWVEKTGWWPDFQPRLLKKSKVTWHDEVHSQPTIEGNVEYLPTDEDLAIVHYNYDSVSDFIQRLDKYTSLEAREENEKTKLTGSKVVQSFSDELLRRLFKDRGIEDGVHGIGLSFLQSMYQVVIVLKRWEKAEHQDASESTAEVTSAVKKLHQDLSYWLADYEVTQKTGLAKFIWKVRRKFRF